MARRVEQISSPSQIVKHLSDDGKHYLIYVDVYQTAILSAISSVIKPFEYLPNNDLISSKGTLVRICFTEFNVLLNNTFDVVISLRSSSMND